MARMVRRFLIAAVIVVGLLIAAIVALPRLVSLEAIRGRALAAAESALHRKVEAGALRIQIFSGLGAGLDKVVVRNAAGWEGPALFASDGVSVKVAFWPLLSRRIVITKVVLDGAVVTLERNAAGALNIDDFASSPPAPPGPGKPSDAAGALLISRLELSRARVLFLDHKVDPGKAVTVSFDDVGGEIVRDGSTLRFDLAGRFLADSGRNLTAKGTLVPAAAGGGSVVKTSFRGQGLALGRLAPYLGDDFGALSADGTVESEGGASGALRLACSLALAPPAGSAIPPIEGKTQMAFDWAGGSLVIEKSPLAVAKLPVTAEGRIEGLRASPRLDLRVETPGSVPLESVAGLPGLGGRIPASVRLAGNARLAARIAGPSSDLDATASLDAAPLEVRVGEERLLSAPSARASLAARGKQPLSGRFTAPSGTLQKLPFQDLAADWNYSAGVLTLSPAAGVFGGRLAARVETDFARPASESRASLDLRSVQAPALIEALTSQRNVLGGTLTGKLSIASQGLDWHALSKTGRGEGRLSIAGADVKTVELMPAITRSLGAVGLVAGFGVPAGLESTRFQTLETTLRLAAGRLATPDLTLTGRDIVVAASGSIGLDRSLDFTGRVILGPALVKSFGNAGRYLGDAQGRLSLPLRVTGPVSSPHVAIDESFVLELGRMVLARQARERVGGPAGNILGLVLEGGGQKGADPANVLQQLLKAAPTPPPRR